MKEERKEMYPLPPNFTERVSQAYIDYKLIVTVKRGMLRVNQVCTVSESKNLAKKKKKLNKLKSHSLSTNVGYLPDIPDPPYTLRRLSAYQEGSQMAICRDGKS